MATTQTRRDKLNNAKVKALEDNTAQSIFKYLQELENRREQVKHRWIWELLQNARDAATHGSSVQIWIEYASGVLTFRHNGKPFTDEEISHLIFHGSTKSSGDAVGHFGSGFISTHLLSKIVHVEGNLDDGSSFKFDLNRDANSPEELKSSMDDSWESFLSSVDENHAHSFSTQYTYPVSSEASPVVESGIAALQHSAAYIVAFNQKIHSLQIKLDEDVKQVRRGQCEELTPEVSVTEIIISSELSESGSRFLATISDGDVTVGALGVKENEVTKVIIQPVPRLFLAFPLHDSGDLSFPAVINSEQFVAAGEDRGGVYLGTGNTVDVRNNERLITHACELTVRLSEAITVAGWAETANLACLKGTCDKNWISGEWYSTLLKDKLIGLLRDSVLMRNAEGDLISPRNSWIPAEVDGDDCVTLWNLLSARKDGGTKIPAQTDLFSWVVNLRAWTEIAGHQFDESLTIRDLAEFVAEKNSLQNLTAEFITGCDELNWLTTLYELILKHDQDKLFDDAALIPDQNFNFQKRNSLSHDSGLDDQLKDIASVLGFDLRSQLMHSGIKLDGIAALLSRPIEQEEILKQILERLKNAAKQDLTEDFENANFACFSWIVSNKRLDLLNSFPFLSKTKSVIGVAADSDSQSIMAPVGAWSEELRRFQELFPEARVLNDKYYEIISDSGTWNDLENAGLIHLTPFITVTAHVDEFVEELSEETDHRSTAELKQKQLVFLEDNDEGFIDRARKSRKRTSSFIRFLVDYAIQTDLRLFNEGEAACQCGQAHHYYLSPWLTRLKERKWVFGARNKSVRPSAASFAEVVRDDLETKQRLTDTANLPFLKALGISPSDLSLRLLSSDERQRLSYMRSVADLQIAFGDDPDRLAAYVSALRSEPEIINLTTDWIQTRKRVHQNQQIGRDIERLLAEELRKHGLRVKRTGVGSDIQVESDFTEEGKEILLTIEGGNESQLVEIKCTRTDDVRMTPKQAETASNTENRFSLCVVSIASSDITGIDLLACTKFVNDIGTQLKPLWQNYHLIETSRTQTVTQLGEITLELSKDVTRFRVSSGAWFAGLNLSEFVEYVRRKSANKS